MPDQGIHFTIAFPEGGKGPECRMCPGRGDEPMKPSPVFLTVDAGWFVVLN